MKLARHMFILNSRLSVWPELEIIKIKASIIDSHGGNSCHHNNAHKPNMYKTGVDLEKFST